ncbi:Fungal specific transcription factor domain-containing protein [Cladophialophora immunda]|nr:Fungal specific transcription factor domain-containing protein [Cladophialophora immunda]
MTVFAQGVGGPQPEYIYCAIAVRLATGLGLHKYSPKALNLSDVEIEDRNRLFWSLYCLDKTIAFRTGRPSLLDDSDIACPFPRHLFRHFGPEGEGEEASEDRFDFFLGVTRYSRICSRIIKNLYSTTSLMQTAESRSRTVAELYDELKQWRATTARAGQDVFSSWTSLRETKLTSTTVLFYQKLMLEYFYHDCVLSLSKACRLQDALHNSSKTSRGRGSQQTPHNPLDQLATDSLESARSMCLMTQQIDIESYTPNWLVIYYPLTAIITLFSHVVTNPLSPSATADIALIQCVMGLFGRIEYVSSGTILLTQSGEFAKIASSVVDKAKNHGVVCENPSPSQLTETTTHQQMGAGEDLHEVSGPEGCNQNATLYPPFLQTQAGNALADTFDFAPSMNEQYQTLNWLDWNFLQDDVITAR